MINITIIGASGYTGVELIRILLGHKDAKIKNLIANQQAGQPIGNIYPHLKIFDLPDLIKLDEADFGDVNLVFCCLPHATSQKIIKTLPDHLKIIDLSADFRIKDTAIYEQWYGEHQAQDLQKDAAYGLSELFRDEIKAANLVACPGCYPTGAVLPLYPLLAHGLIANDSIIIDAKTGATGAGRAIKQESLFSEVNEGIKAYSICQHRHMPEIEQSLSIAAGDDVKVTFTPQLIPASRGILSTIYVNLADGVQVSDLQAQLQKTYENEPFVHIMDAAPSTRDVFATNNCLIFVAQGRSENQAVIVSVIDNLTKGSSGQAVQNMNIMFGLDEMEGLRLVPVYP